MSRRALSQAVLILVTAAAAVGAAEPERTDDTGTGYDLYRMTPDGETVTRVLSQPLPFHEYGPVWTPDGSRAIYTVIGADWKNTLFVANGDLSDPVQITNQ